MPASILLRLARHEAKGQLRGWRRELERPWREGPKGAAADAGRWIGFALAVAACAAGLGAAVYVEWQRGR